MSKCDLMQSIIWILIEFFVFKRIEWLNMIENQGQNFPKVGIALAAYRPHPEYFLKQLETIQSQTFREWVCVITFDSEMDIFKNDLRFAPYFNDSRFHWFQNEVRLGYLANFESALRRCLSHSVRAVAFCDQDDAWYPEKIQSLYERLLHLPPCWWFFDYTVCAQDTATNGSKSNNLGDGDEEYLM